MIFHLLLALIIWFGGFFVFGKFIAPRWKVAGKFIAYFAITILLSFYTGHWALIWIIGHQFLGWAGHIWWCRKHGINWITCEPRQKYLELRPWAEWDGFEKKTNK